MEELMDFILNRDIEGFTSTWEGNKDSFDEADKQAFLTEMIAFNYDDKEFPFFEKVLDQMIDESFNLDFNIEHWAPTFLCLSIHVVSQQLFDYLLARGAHINFIGDPYAFEDDDYIRNELKLEDRRYATCLDFATLKLSEMMGSDYTYQRPDWTGIDAPWAEIDPKEELTVSKRYYAYVVEQAQYLYEVIHLNQLVEHIKAKGGKSYAQLR